jgi:hypothetical protein
MPKLSTGVSVNKVRGTNSVRLRIKAGPFRDQYVDTLILEAKLGRKLRPGYTVEHLDGNPLNIDPANLEEVTRAQNTTMMHARYGHLLAGGGASVAA